MRSLLLLIPACLVSGLLMSGQTAPAPKAPAPAKAPAAKANYKEIGSQSATVSFEAYTDYECPHCGVFFRDIMPQIMAQYVQTGKVKFIHRDFPLTQMHPHAQMAARYANAAGQLGFYELAVNQIFKTQDAWSLYGKNSGDIDGELVKVLPPGAMQKIREMVKVNDPKLDESIKKDVEMGMRTDNVNGTPTVVIVKNGKRDVVPNAAQLPFSIWKSYLDKVLSN